ncbi:MAG TPA: BTAD domain-containing putative transcriptional regulator [Candidatus Dormibacteraeota bacterium]|nr:BTAD domain-containing putative transcriptional regulator [Candidatus Dormibacteraeota bacterium]
MKLLGGYEASLDGHPIWFRTRKTFALFAYLALDPRPHRRETIAELLWPGGDGADARANLRTALVYVRGAIGNRADAILTANRDTVGVAPGSVDVDIDVLRAARQRIRQPGNVALRQELESAVGLYHGPFLAELVFPDAPELEAWIEAQRAYWRNVATELLSLVATLQESAGEPGSSLATLERWTEVSRDDEPAWQRLIETHLNQKDQLAARHAWDGYFAAIRELDAAPSEPMTRLYERVLGRADIRRPVKPPMGRWVRPAVHSFAGA